LSAKVERVTLGPAAVKLPLLLVAVLVTAIAVSPAPAIVSGPRAGPTMVVVDVPLHGDRSLAAASPHARFDLVGLHWQGSGAVLFRTRSLAGRWSPWHASAPEAEDLPNPSSHETRTTAGWRLGNPWWTGPSDRIEYRFRGRVGRLRAFFVRSPEEATPTRVLEVAGSPAIVSRAGWGADESIVTHPPQYADSVRFAIVHHTAGSNTYTQAQAPAVVRGIELYHVQGNGWNDIGYNLLVDRFGTVYEGRAGGVDRNVVGAHALGFNTGSVGIAVLGTYTDSAPPAAAQDALARTLAWRLDLAHVDPVSTLTVISGGSERYSAGKAVQLRAVSGHRDTGLTECPGNALYALLDTIASRAQGIGLPKIYAPTAVAGPNGLVRFTARISSPRPWTVTVTDAAGLVVATGVGTGATVDWSWNTSTAAAGTYRWQIAAGGALTASGAVAVAGGPSAALAITGVTSDQETISPNGDGVADAAMITYTTTARALVTVTAVDASGAPVALLQPATDETAGAHTVSFTGNGLPDGSYGIRIDAADAAGKLVSSTVTVAVSRLLAAAAASPAVFSPNGDGRSDRITFSFDLDDTAAVRVRILRDGAWVATPFDGQLAAGHRFVRWDGAKRVGKLLDGAYTAVVEATDSVGTISVELPFSSDTRAPVVRILRGVPLRVWVSKPATLTMRINGTPVSQVVSAAGEARVQWRGPASRVRVVAWDDAGNVSRPVSRP
jgi:hypothetical protein